ncbi:MAG: hypothetical protein L0H15_09775 [Nitrosospira sp.]|nr:hypothetical protein [Nitrosospira sp.]MDN5936866.1 hypothetical protein [Nitrosospira sp.]
MATLRKQRAKTNTDAAKEAKTSKVAAAKPHKPPAPVKTSQGIQKNEKSRKPVRRSQSEEKTDETRKAAKPKKIKLVRDSYSIPESEQKQIAELKQRCINHGRRVKKSYLLRAGIQVLALMDDSELLAAVEHIK